MHLESPVPSLSIDQISRLVRHVVTPNFTLSAANQGTTGSFGNLTVTPNGNADLTTTDELMFWFPDATGAGNILTTKIAEGITDTTMLSRTLKAYKMGQGLQHEVQKTNMYRYTVPALDPDVRASFGDAAVRTTAARCILDINMGGGHGRLRATPVTKDMFNMKMWQIQAHLMADAHTVHKIQLSGSETKRLKFEPWIQSRRALGDYTTRSNPYHDDEDTSIPRPGAAERTTADQGIYYSNGYSDQFPFGGWVFAFEFVSMSAMGAIPLMTMTSSVTVQVQLPLSMNHLAHRGKATALKAWHDKFSSGLALPKAPTPIKPGGDAVEAARPQSSSLRGSMPGEEGKAARGKQQAANSRAKAKAAGKAKKALGDMGSVVNKLGQIANAMANPMSGVASIQGGPRLPRVMRQPQYTIEDRGLRRLGPKGGGRGKNGQPRTPGFITS